MSSKSDRLTLLVKPCNNGMCPALYRDRQGRLFVQGNRLAENTQDQIAIAGNEEIVELAPEILDFLRSYQD